MKIEDYTLEDICEKINIQSHLSDLQSGKKTQIKSALTTLSSIVSITKRKDALYALLGYYLLEINSTEEIEKFFDLTKNTNSIDLYRLILQDISKHKNIFRKKLFSAINSIISPIFSSSSLSFAAFIMGGISPFSIL